MSFGARNGRQVWCLEEEDSLPVIEAAYNAGINFFDTANTYSNGRSEEILGLAIRKYGFRRSNIVVATKVWAPVGHVDGDNYEDALLLTHEERDQKGYLNEYGLSRKHIFDSVDASLKRLGLEYIDLLQIHRFDPNTPVKETMKALHDIVESGKVRYIGASAMYAHELMELQYTARLHGWTEFISMQNFHNATYREEEREMIPAIRKFGMGMIPYGPLAMGFLARPVADLLATERMQAYKGALLGQEFTDIDRKINEKIEDIAKKRGASMAVVALAWSLKKPFMTSPIIGMSSLERVEEACKAVEFELTDEEEEGIDGLYRVKELMGINVEKVLKTIFPTRESSG